MLFYTPSDLVQNKQIQKTLKLELADALPLAEEANTDLICTGPDEVGLSLGMFPVKREK